MVKIARGQGAEVQEVLWLRLRADMQQGAGTAHWHAGE
jgi:hypothetical protein